MPLIDSLFPILIALAAGFALGRCLPARWSARAGRLVMPLVWLLLFLIGSEFGTIITSAGAIGEVLRSAMVFAVLTTLGPWIFLGAAGRRILPPSALPSRHPAPRPAITWRLAWAPLKEAVIALSMVALGGVWHVINTRVWDGVISTPSSGSVLLLLIVFVGADLARTDLKRSWFSLRMLWVPVGVVAGSLAGGALAAWITQHPLATSLALSSGYGWFTLSSVLIGQALGDTYGTLALMTDLLRELLAIAVLYALGPRYPALAVGNAGATAMDSTLPIIKQACPPQAVPVALVSGLTLSLVAPLMIALLI